MLGRVYKIICLEDPDIIYIGSTTQLLSRRMSKHRTDYKRWLEGKAAWLSIYPYFKELGIKKFKIVEIERYEVEDIMQLRKYEQEHIDKSVCVNKLRAYISEEERKEYHMEYMKNYRENNKDELSDYRKYYYENKKDIILEKNKEYYENHKDKILDWHSNYREENKDIILEKARIYYHLNKEKSLEKRKEKVNCPNCNILMRKDCISRHIKKSCKKVEKQDQPLN